MKNEIKTVTKCPECGQEVKVCGDRDGTQWYQAVAGDAGPDEKACGFCSGRIGA